MPNFVDWGENARMEKVRLAKAALNCRVGKRGTKTAGAENTRTENTGTYF